MQCNQLNLNGLLSGNGLADDDPRADHVAECTACQQKLASLAGGEFDWQEISDVLKEGLPEETPARNGDSSVVIMIDPSLAEDVPAACEPVSLDFLEEPSHPEMLGRLGRYEIERVIGAGGHGVVLKGFDTELHRPAAIKVLAPHLAGSGAARTRFAREAQAAAAIVHDHVIPIHDVASAGKLPYLVMPFVPGRSLQQRIDDLSALIEQLDLRDITLVVHDWGGAIGLGTAIRLKERFSRLVLLNTGAFPPPYVPLRIRVCRTPLLGNLAMRGLNAFARAAVQMAVGKGKRLAPAVRAGLLAPYDNWQNRVAIARFVEDIPFTRRHETWSTLETIEQGLPSLADRPVTIIWGMQDWCFTPVCLQRFRQLFPDASVHEIDSAGHYVMEDAADEIVRLLQESI